MYKRLGRSSKIVSKLERSAEQPSDSEALSTLQNEALQLCLFTPPPRLSQSLILQKRAWVNQGAIDLIASLEGFRSDFNTDSVGHTAIGTI